MFRHHLIFALRRLVHEKGYTLVTLIGLVTGISAFLVLFLFVANEKSFDRHIPGHERIYRVHTIPDGGEETPWARSLGFILPASVSIPEVKEVTQFAHSPEGIVKIDDQTVRLKDVLSVDENFFEMFNIRMITGDYGEIAKPNVVFITEEMARKYFGHENPVGKSIEIDELQYYQKLGPYEIRGVVESIHPKTHFRFDMLTSQKGGMQGRFNHILAGRLQWIYSYVKLNQEANPDDVSGKFQQYYDANLKDKMGYPPVYHRTSLMPLTDIRLKSTMRFELRENASQINLTLFIVISFVVLLVSLLNFINLTIARIIRHSREFGLRKSIGAGSVNLTTQILTEVFIISLLAIGLSMFLIEVVKPALNNLFGIGFSVFYTEPTIYLSITGVLIFTLGMTAIFVTFHFLRKTTAIEIISAAKNFSGNLIMRSLLTLQMAIVISLLAATLAVNRQIHFVLNKPLGFDKENILVIRLKDLSKDKTAFMNELKMLSHVVAVGATVQYFGSPTQNSTLEGFGLDGNIESIHCDFDFIWTMGIELTESWFETDQKIRNGVIINNHFYSRILKYYGSMEAFKEYKKSKDFVGDLSDIALLGVVKDFNYHSAHVPLGNFAFVLHDPKTSGSHIHVRLAKGDIREALLQAGKVFEKHYPGNQMDYFFLDEEIARQYRAETILRRILLAFSLIGMLISIIGISAFSLFISQQRTKEIGIRKVNGATILEILKMLNKDFVKWVVVAFVIATPIAWYAMNKWLQNFAYKTDLSWWIFALAGLLALGIALLTVSWQSWRAAVRNPVEALRYE
jgi:putative ABC transport system permease protein